MKKVHFLSFALLLFSAGLQAKKVKFSVDMTGLTVLSTGVHVAGDFQTLAGYAGGDFNAGTTQMFQEPSDTNIYSVIVDIPAFAKYEFRFFNGDQSYETEFIPVLSQIGYNFNDNRWIYVDSTANDTTFVGAIPFSGNAPTGKKLLRVLVDMQNQNPISINGVHVSGSFNNFDLMDESMYSFTPYVYEKIVYVDAGINEFKYFNGNTLNDAEIVPAACELNGNRSIEIAGDTLLSVVCFSSCDACIASSNENKFYQNKITIVPNPSQHNEMIMVQNIGMNSDIKIYEMNGSLIKEFNQVAIGNFSFSAVDLARGIYFIQVINQTVHCEKIVIQ
jgi:hypothetical protein